MSRPAPSLYRQFSGHAVAAPLAITFTHQLIGSFFLLTAPVLAPLIAERAQVSSSLIGSYTALAYLAAMVASGLSGRAFAMLGALTSSAICIVFTVVGLTLLVSTTPWLIGLSALVIGFGYGPLTPASSHVLAAHSPPRWKNTIMAAKQTGVPIGGTLAGLSMPLMIVALGWGWGMALPALAGLAIALVALPRCRMIDQRTPPPAKGRMAAENAPFSRWMLTLGAGAFCYAGVQMSLTAFLGLYFVEYLHLSVAAAGGMIAVFQMAGLTARVGWGALADRFGERVPLFALIGLTIMAAVTAFLTIAQPDTPASRLIVATFVLGIFCNSWTGLYFAEIIRAVRLDEMGRTTGMALMFTFAGVVVVPPLIGVAVSMTSFPVAFMLIGALGAAGAMAGLVARITSNRAASNRRHQGSGSTGPSAPRE